MGWKGGPQFSSLNMLRDDTFWATLYPSKHVPASQLETLKCYFDDSIQMNKIILLLVSEV